MRQRDLEIALETVPRHPGPRPDLEQYRTPPTIAADLLVRAFTLGDIDGKRVLDLGCGTGMLALGAALFGAEATGVDVDPSALAEAKRAADRLFVKVRFVEADVREADLAGSIGPRVPFDTVLSNPPFGAQLPGADRPFYEAGIRMAPVLYVFFLSKTADFVRRHLGSLGADPTHAWDYDFPIPHQFRFHERAVEHVPVTVARFERRGHERPGR